MKIYNEIVFDIDGNVIYEDSFEYYGDVMLLQVKDHDGDGKITTSDFNAAPKILQTQMRNFVGGTTENVAGRKVMVLTGRGEVKGSGGQDYIYTVYETDASGNYIETDQTMGLVGYWAPGKKYSSLDVIDEKALSEGVTVDFTPDADYSEDVTLGEVGQYREDVFVGQEKAYEDLWGDDGYYARVFGGKEETYNALKDAYTNAGLPTPTETELRAR